MGELEGKVAVITGAGSGMARASAKVFVREGARVLGADVSGREQETAEELGDSFVPFHADVSRETDVEAMFAAALAAFGRVDAVLNVAGIGSGGALADATVEEYDRIMSVNLLGVMLGTKHGIRAMVPTGGGSIVNWSSTGGMNGSKTPVAIYCASKAGVISFTKQAAIEYARDGIRANAICPGLIVTELSGGREAIEKFPHLVKGAPMRRAGEPEEVAELACFLASDRAPFLTGAVIPIDGGLTRDDALTRLFRFGFTGGVSSKREKLLASARTVEALGYSTFGLADHFVRPFAPLVAGQAVADATTTLRVTQTVLAQDFREPAVLAKELATLDVLSEGRLQVGLGAGWLRQEYEDASMRFESASVRIARLEETAVILKGLFSDEPFSFAGEHYTVTSLQGRPTPVQRPRPPIMIGGGGKKVLSVAARQADIVQLMPSNRGGRTSLDPSQFSAPALEEKIGWIRDAAGSRFEEVELSAQLIECAITDRPEEHLSDLAERIATVTARMGGGRIDLGHDDLRRSPIVAVGSLDEVCQKLVDTRERYGISYFTAPIEAPPEVMAPVIERLAGT